MSTSQAPHAVDALLALPEDLVPAADFPWWDKEQADGDYSRTKRSIPNAQWSSSREYFHAQIPNVDYLNLNFIPAKIVSLEVPNIETAPTARKLGLRVPASVEDVRLIIDEESRCEIAIMSTAAPD